MSKAGGDRAAVTAAGDMFCASCGEPIEAEEAFCTGCGASLRNGSKNSHPAPLAAGDDTAVVEAVAGAPTEPWARWRRWAVGVGLLVIVAVAGLAVAKLVLAWSGERSSRRNAQHELALTRAKLATAQSNLAATRASLTSANDKLATTTQRLKATAAQLHVAELRLAKAQKTLTATKSLSKRQRAILARTATVLTQVDPLLSGVDRLQQVTGEIQSQRDNFGADAGTLISELTTIANYLLNTYPAYIDPFYLQSLIDTANNQLDVVRGDEATLGSSDADYADASNSFGNSADRFTAAIRGLQRDLRALSK